MKKKFIALFISIFILFSFQTVHAQTLSTTQCASGYTVYFGNGVRTELTGAYISTRRISKMLGNTYNNEILSVYTSYNPTDGFLGAGDLIEVFAQKLAEDPTLKWQLFFRWISGQFISTALSIALQDYINVNGTQKLAQAVTTLSSSQAYSDPVVIRHSQTYEQALLAGQRVMLVSHSQGNLYANAIYGRLQSRNSGAYDLNAFGLAGVASPANFVATGDSYVTSDTDHVIDVLRLLAPATLPSNDSSVPFTTVEDRLGHGFVEIYTNQLFGSIRDHVKNMMLSTLARLSTVTPNFSGGPITATLTWNSPGDIDLHTFEPSGSHVYYANRVGAIGYLDRDDTSGTGPEHYYASCQNFIPGNYTFGVNYYSGTGVYTAAVKISVLGVDYPVKYVILSTSRGSSGDNSPVILWNINIQQSNNGEYTATVQ